MCLISVLFHTYHWSTASFSMSFRGAGGSNDWIDILMLLVSNNDSRLGVTYLWLCKVEIEEQFEQWIKAFTQQNSLFFCCSLCFLLLFEVNDTHQHKKQQKIQLLWDCWSWISPHQVLLNKLHPLNSKFLYQFWPENSSVQRETSRIESVSPIQLYPVWAQSWPSTLAPEHGRSQYKQDWLVCPKRRNGSPRRQPL